MLNEIDEGVAPKPKRSHHKKKVGVALPVPVACDQPAPTYYQTLMSLRTQISAATAQPWHVVVMMNPLFEDKPDSPFTIKMRGTKEFVGQWPADLTAAQVTEIAGEVAAIYTASNQPIVQATEETHDEEGNVVVDPRVVGKMVSLTLANGETIQVVPRNAAPRESERSEAQRIADELAQADEVEIEYVGDQPDTIGWNGQEKVVYPGLNLVKKPFADVYRQSRQQHTPPLDLDTRRRRGLPGFPGYQEVEGFLNAR